jgi:hypothetical protein
MVYCVLLDPACTLPLLGVRFSFLTQKIASAEMGDTKVFDDLRTLSALATARAACARFSESDDMQSSSICSVASAYLQI